MPAATDLKFKKPIDLADKIAFQYCHNPRKDPPNEEEIGRYQFIIVDDWFCYPDFQNYHGPSNLAHVIRFGQIIEELYAENDKIVCVRTSPKSMQRSNVALLISTYLFFECKLNIEEITEKMDGIYETVVPYRTEGEGPCDHKILIKDCLLGLQMAFNHLPSLKLNEFDVEDLLWMEQPQNGDLNWIIPGQLLALAGPTSHNWPISKFIDYANKTSIGCMVRLNRAHYEAEELTRTGNIEHVEMFMHDGTNPSPQNVRDFIEIVDKFSAKRLAVAVHCRAGLGRTGTMIGSYLLFKFARDHKFTRNHARHSHCPCLNLKPEEVARAIIGFLRIMRPGSVLSGQPEFLESISATLMKAGAENDTSSINSFENLDEIDDIPRVEEEEEIEINTDTIDAESVKLRSSKRLRLSVTSTSSDSLISNQHQHPVSHAGRGHAAEKHSTVQIEKL